jgi:RimJ/RimL family protein N-acetyltransferase
VSARLDPILTTRFVIRDVNDADADTLFGLDSDPEVMRHIGPPPTDLQSYRERIRSAYLPHQSHPWHGVRLVHARSSGEFLGSVALLPSPCDRDAECFGWVRMDEVEIGFRYHRASWGLGTATEVAARMIEVAFADPATSAVVACADEDNTASLRVLSKLGFAVVAPVLLPRARIPTVTLILRR